ncbi:phage shock protein A, PspA [Pseudomonas fluorescens WH6]|nr:phage shock protein A, PspA [Pseudomonas fluorescens WH6]
MTQSIWSKLFTALRGGASEVGESIVDQQALRILDQEIRDADTALANAKRELVSIMAKHKLAADRVASTTPRSRTWNPRRWPLSRPTVKTWPWKWPKLFLP